jgi:hypothetical protein
MVTNGANRMKRKRRTNHSQHEKCFAKAEKV